MSGYVVGITGGIASGKTNLTDALRKAGAQVVDADEVSRALTGAGGEALPLIRADFGDGVFSGGSLDRAKLGKLIFSDPEAKKKLEELLHPLILSSVREEIRKSETPVVFLSAPLLFECGLDRDCDEIWCAWVPQKEQLRRLMSRDGLSRAEALRRVKSQMPARSRRARSSLVLRTDGTPAQSAEKVLAAYQALLTRLGARTANP